MVRKLMFGGDPIATAAWNNMLSGKSFYRHYWKSELLEWINHLKDCEQGPCTLKNSDYQRIRQEFKINGHQLWDLGFWNLMSDVLSHYAVVKIRDWGTYYHFLHANLNAAEWLIFLAQGDQRYAIASRHPWRHEPADLCATTSAV